MKDIIKLKSRYIEDNNYLELVPDTNSKKYLLKTDYSVRIGRDKDSESYSFVDLSGGPFIQIGTVIEGMTVKSIKKSDKGVLIEFE